MKVQDLLTDEGKWTQGTSALDAVGRGVDPWDPTAVRWCLVGAVGVCYRDNPAPARWAIRRYLSLPARQHLQLLGISDWNDAPERTFADVRRLIEELDI